jgi:hypothetical protein
MHQTTPLLVATAIVLVGGGIQGIASHRWTTNHEVEQAAARLDRVALAVGDWKGQALESSAQDFARAGIVGQLLRRYVNQRTGDVVTLLIVCGRPGSISVHTPEVCYAGAGYEVLGQREKLSSPRDSADSPTEMWKVRLRKVGAIAPELLAVCYGWSTTGVWRAPARDARFEFAGSPYLYKMYLVHSSTTTGGPQEVDPSVEFLRALVPGLRRSLFPAP